MQVREYAPAPALLSLALYKVVPLAAVAALWLRTTAVVVNCGATKYTNTYRGVP